MDRHTELREVEFRGKKFTIPVDYFTDEEGTSWTTTESDTIWYDKLREEYFKTLPIPIPNEETIIYWDPSDGYWKAFRGKSSIPGGHGKTPDEALKDAYDEKNN